MDFVTFGIAKKLKKKGFQEECLCHYIDKDLVYNIESPISNNQLWFWYILRMYTSSITCPRNNVYK